MPLYPDQKILFIHIPKTAGIFISRVLGVDFGQYYKKYRPSLEDSYQLFAQCDDSGVLKARVRSSLSMTRKFRELVSSKKKQGEKTNPLRKHLIGGTRLDLSLQNMTASELMRFGYISRQDLMSFKKIVSVRHPEDRFRSLISYWNLLDVGFDVDWVIKNCLVEPNPLIPVEVLATFSPMSFYIQCPMIEMSQWYVIRFEHLLDDLKPLADDLGCTADLESIPKINSSESGVISLTPQQTNAVRAHYAADFELFGYK